MLAALGRYEQVYLATSSVSCQEQIVSTEARVLSVSQENGKVSVQAHARLEYLLICHPSQIKGVQAEAAQIPSRLQ